MIVVAQFCSVFWLYHYGYRRQKYIFDKFYREQKGNIHDIKGHGLGLAYVKEIIDTHHGTVFVDSEKGKGSTFTVKLPLI